MDNDAVPYPGNMVDEMILELRTYDFAPGDALRYLDFFATEGLPLITRHLPLAGYWLSEVGALNRLRHLWVYSDLDERSSKRALFMGDREWTEGFLPRGMTLIRRQATQLIEPEDMSAPFQDVITSVKPHGAHYGASLRNGWATLHTQALQDAFFTGCVIAGEEVGQTISIAPSAHKPALELMRPCAFSPL